MQDLFNKLFGAQTQPNFAPTLRARIDSVEIIDDEISMKGWVLHDTHPIKAISIIEQGNVLISGLQPTIPRPELRIVLPQYPYIDQCGFAFQTRLTHPVNGPKYHFKIVAEIGGLKPATTHTVYVNEEEVTKAIPLPPSHLQKRVRGTDTNFLTLGYNIYCDLKSHIENLRPMSSFDRILDWGCGCSNILRFLLDDVPASKVCGCDIDSEAIDWNNKFVPGPSFAHVNPTPPTPYADGYFDLIFGISVFTHLNEEMQYRWLEELRRITAPNGIVAMSIFGPQPDHREAIHKNNGFLDIPAAQAADFAPFSDNDYYRLTFHNKNYIRTNWSRHFIILDIIDRGINRHQDLVIMRR